MGIEVAIGAAIAAASVATGVMQLGQAKKASKAREEGNKVSTAQQQSEAAASRRRAVREARIRRAMVLNQAENTGTSESSGALGATGVIGTNVASANAEARGQTRAIQGINAANQRAANYEYKAARIGAFGDIFTSGLSAFQTPKQNQYG